MKTLPRRYFGTPFNRAQIVQMQDMLGLERKEYAVIVAEMIWVRVHECSRKQEVRRRIPEVKAVKRRLDSMSIMAGHLARLLQEEPIAERLIHEPGSFLTRADSDGVIHIDRLRQEDLNKLAELIAALRMVSQNAERYSKDDVDFRCVYELPPLDDAEKLTYRIWLWPTLFEVWEMLGKKVAYTKDGPLHRFISFVHDVCNLPKPSASTLKSALLEWEQDPRRAKIAEGPPWWILGED
ncbi:hypothetical protein AAII07_54285 [Microvirga sp. 0TCS3.31]